MSDKESLPQNIEKNKIYVEISAKPNQSISDTCNPKNPRIIYIEKIDHVTEQSAAFSEEDYAFAKTLIIPSTSDEKHCKNNDIGQSSDSSKEVNLKKAKKQRHRNSRKHAKEPQEKFTNSKSKGHNVGILHYNYPDELLSYEQLILIEEAILKNVHKQADEIIKPRFLKSNLKIGWLLLFCADRNTVEWLKELCLKPWADANLIIKEEKDILQASTVYMGKFPNGLESNEEILKFLKAQNSGINTADWKVYNRRETQKKINLTFCVDHNSVQQLENNFFKLNYKFGVVKLVKTQKPFNP